VQIAIEYCGTCNYRPRAASLAWAIQEAVGIKPLLVHSQESGTYKIIVDGDILYSKLATSAFPKTDEIVDMLKKRQVAV